jgi:hypothetical protein
MVPRVRRVVSYLTLGLLAGATVGALETASSESPERPVLARHASRAAPPVHPGKHLSGVPQPSTPSLEWGEVEDVFGRNPVVAIPIFAHGTATVVWASNHRIWTRQAIRTGAWQAARSAPHGVQAPSLIGASSDHDGTLTVVGKTAPNIDRYRIYAWRRPLGGSWSKPQLLASGPRDDDFGTEMQMSVNRRGAVLVTWIEPTTYRARALYRTAGGSWDKPITFTTRTWFEGIGGTVGRRGQALVTYPSSAGRVVAVRRVDGRWRKPIPLPVRPSPQPMYAIAQSSYKTYLAWRTDRNAIRVGELTNRGWQSSRRVANNVTDTWSLQANASADGSGLVFWTRGPFATAEPFSLHGVRRESEGPWQSPKVLIPEGVANAPEVTSNRRGDLLLSWLGPGREGATYDVEPYVMYLPNGHNWSEAVDIGAGTGSNTGNGTPQVALAHDSRALVLWQSLTGQPPSVDWGPTLLRRGYPAR